MLELINRKGIPQCDGVRHLAAWLRPLASAGADLHPFIFDPEWSGRPSREDLLATGMEADEVDAVLHTSVDDFHPPDDVLSILHEAAEVAERLIRSEAELRKVVREIGELIRGCEAARNEGETVQITADYEEDVDDEDEDDEDEDDEDYDDEDDED